MKYTFPKNFLFGSATSGPQSEGFYNKANESIWDHWCKIDISKFHNEVGCEYTSRFYETFREDIKLMKELGHNSFRTSIQWSRLIKDFYTLEVSEDGVQFYNNLIDELIKNNIEPMICLSHFDMPLKLQEDLGGWESKKTTELFALYAKKSFELFGDRVKKWFTFNEPVVVPEGGYLYKWHYPSKTSFKEAVNVGYNINLASAKAIREYRKLGLKGEIGIILNLTPSYPRDINNKEDVKSAQICDLLFNRSFLDPAIHGVFPKELISFLTENNLMPECTKEESEIIKENTINILGVNYYQPRRVKQRETKTNYKTVNEIMPDDFYENYEMPGRMMNPHRGWEIYYKGVYDIGKNIKENYNNIKWFVSENGMGVEGEEKFLKNDNGKSFVEDDYRIEFIKEHMKCLLNAIYEGSNCIGYHLWTFIDCWSWLNSYKNRYGYIRYDLKTKEKTIKKSGRWISEVVKNNGFDD